MTGFNTKCVHAGNYIDEKVGGVNTPIYASSSFLNPNPSAPETCYPRYMNIPTQKAAAEKIAALENAEDAIVLSSGMAAIAVSLFAFLQPGDHAVFQADLYGGARHLIDSELKRRGATHTLVREMSPKALAEAVRPETTLVYLESPTNPLMRVIDLRRVIEMLKPFSDQGLVTMIDNTFATPVNQIPLDLGFDLSIHSATKYMSGHSDMQCGAVAGKTEPMKKVRAQASMIGPTLNVLDCHILERSLKTLGLRMARHNENGQAVAEFLSRSPLVSQVNYPGLPSHPGHEIAKSQMSGFGGMLSFELAVSPQKAREIVSRLKIITPGISLGGVESLITFPAETSHYLVPPEERAAMGVTDTLLRLSTGIEDAQDLINDLDQAFSG